MQITAYGQTDVGQKKPHNEDSFLILEDVQLYIVCDGVGGLAAGEVASKLGCEQIANSIKKNIEPIKNFKENSSPANRNAVMESIVDAVCKASKSIYDHSQKEGKSQMASTLVMCLIINENAFIAHVGDSRLYLFRNGEGHQMTDDHSFVNEMVKNGILTEEKAKNHPQANVISRALGFREIVDVETLHLELESGDQLLLCSDGLHHYFELEQFEKLLKTSDAEKFNKLAVTKANSRGGHDNITSLLIEVKSPNNINIQKKAGISQKIAVLKKLQLFSKLDYKELTKVLEIIKVKTFPAKQMILHEGDMGDEMYVLLTGSVEVLVTNKHVKHLTRGEYFGEMALIDQEIRSASVVTNEKTKTLVIQREDLLDLFKRENRIGLKIMWAMLQHANTRLRWNDSQIFRQAE